MTETRLVRRQIDAMYRQAGKWGRKSDLLLLKVHGGPHQTRGISDILGTYLGLSFHIESKLPGKEKNLSRYQAAMLKKCEAAGSVTALCTTVPQALEVLKEVRKKAKKLGLVS